MYRFASFLFVLLFPLSAFGSAFLIYNQDAKANGMAMACASSIDNASAVFFNPANLPYLEGSGVLLNTILIAPHISFRNQTSGEKIDSRSKTHTLFSLFGYHTGKNWSFGIGLFSPFGLSTEWRRNFPGKYYSLSSSMKTLFFNPVFALKIKEGISIAGGFSYVESSAKFKSLIPVTDGLFSLSGEGQGMGYNFALSIGLPRDHNFSFVFRSPVRIRYDGEAVISQDFPFPSFRARCYTYFNLPFLISSGLSKKTERTTYEFDLLYTGWSSMNTYRIRSEDPLFSRSYHKGWSNTISLSAGINRKLKEGLELRIGYMYDITPVPLSTRGPELPDSTRNIVTLGGSYSRGGLDLGFSYQATYFKKAKSSLPGLLGHYRNFAHLLSIHIGYWK